MTDSPDMWMGVSVDKLVRRTGERVNRLTKISKMIEKESDLDRQELIRNTLALKEIQMCHNIAVAVKARAKEVVEYMTKHLYLENVTEEKIKENPWLICCAAGYQLDRICMLLDARDAANNVGIE